MSVCSSDSVQKLKITLLFVGAFRTLSACWIPVWRCRAQSLALYASSSGPAYLSPSPDHFLLPLKLGAPLCCRQTGYPTSCERQEGALLRAPDTQSALQQLLNSAHRLPTTEMFPCCKTETTVNAFLLNWSKTTSNQKNFKTENRPQSVLGGEFQICRINSCHQFA